MYEDVYLRTIKYARYIVDNKSTIRATAKNFGVAKSTVHYDLSKRLPSYNEYLYLQVKKVLQINFDEKHIRGGMATKQKYLQERQADEFNDFIYYGC